mgnify:CR=1 FL=1
MFSHLLNKTLTRGATLLAFLTLFYACLRSAPALASPEMTAHGYNSCNSCHMSPTGGGALTAYGKGVAAEIVSTWGDEQEAETFYGLFNLKPFALHGDFRYLYHRYEDENIILTQKFMMQRELGISFEPSKNVKFFFSGGYYGYEPEYIEYRKYFLSVGWGGLNLRAGRFRPAFGVEIPDHSKATRQFLGQGSETSNVELSFTSRYAEVFLTRTFGRKAVLTSSDDPKVNVKDDEGYTAKLNLFILPGIQLGGSYAYIEDEAEIEEVYAANFMLGNKKIFLTGEQQFFTESEPYYLAAGYWPFKGFLVRVEVDGKPELEPEIFYGVQWNPRPHWEFSGSVSKQNIIATTHYYL